MSNCLKAWDEIGVSPFTQKVYRDLLGQKKKEEAVAKLANIDPEKMTVQNMVKKSRSCSTWMKHEAVADQESEAAPSGVR